jgi:hypothetical protein
MTTLFALLFTIFVIIYPPRQLITAPLYSAACGFCCTLLIGAIAEPPDGIPPLAIAIFAIAAGVEAMCFALKTLTPFLTAQSSD